MTVIRYLIGLSLMVIGWAIVDQFLPPRELFSTLTLWMMLAFGLFSIGYNFTSYANRDWPWNI